jgi:hypothetical protein
MATAKPFPLDFPAGVQRDGTEFDSQHAIDALWCRWRMGKPRKMGGFVAAFDAIPGIPRRMHAFYLGNAVIIHIGHTAGLIQVVLDRYGDLFAFHDRTPTTFAGGIDVGWTFDAIYDTTSQITQLVAHAVADITDIANAAQTTPFIGQIDGTGKLSAFSAPDPSLYPGGNYTQPKVAGGVFCSQPSVWAFDAYGGVQWSAPNLPLTLGVNQGNSGAGSARISAQKIIAGMALRGGGTQSPAALLWSMSEVISASFVGGQVYYAFNTVSPSSSIISTDCVIEYDGLYFWVGVDRFLMFNGTVVEVPNQMNQDWFFDNLTPGYEAKTYATKIPRYGEIWFCAAMFGATEPSHAAIYNIRENTWYDTELPNGGRSSAYFAQGFRYPLMGGSVADSSGNYKLWVHEKGTDQLIPQVPAGQPTPTAVRSYFQTPWMGGPKNNPPADAGLSTEWLEPDFVQAGNLNLTVVGRANARSTAINTVGPYPILETGTVPQEEITAFKTNNRITSLIIESNVVGGNYITGRSFLHGDIGTSRVIS